MFIKYFAFSADDNGIEFVMYEEKPSKTRQRGRRKKRRANGGHTYPMKPFKHFWNEGQRKFETTIYLNSL